MGVVISSLLRRSACTSSCTRCSTWLSGVPPSRRSSRTTRSLYLPYAYHGSLTTATLTTHWLQQALHPDDEMAFRKLGSLDASRAVAARRDGISRTATQGGVLEGFEATMVALRHSTALARRGGGVAPPPPPLVLAPGVRRALRDVDVREVFASYDAALRGAFRGGGRDAREWLGLDAWLALSTALEEADGAALLSRAHAIACYHATLLAPPDGSVISVLSFAAFKEAVARAAAYLCHGRAAVAPGAHPLVAQLRRLCETIVASAGGMRKPAAAVAAAAPAAAAAAAPVATTAAAPVAAVEPAAAAHAAPPGTATPMAAWDA